ncbi:MAG TPA: glycosyltransferase family 25 protein [Rhizomicrobium sp.]|jgi:glycosyl transferase family 25|nr:glycosyltransferase family 25 protein [Rhizomicrobium sp.]
MQSYLINLTRRADRRRNMTAQLSNLEIPLQLVTAVDARHMPDAVADRSFAADGPLGPIPKGDKCCTLSHMRAWSMFLSSGDSHGLILEDDVAIDPKAAALLRDESWIPRGIGLLKIEHYGPESQRVLLDGLIDTGGGRQIGRLLSRHTGAGAYILSRETAQLLLTWSELWTLPVDHMLFNPNNSPLAERLRPYQLTPAVARQSEAIGGRTDIDEWRAGLRDFSWRFVRREMVRAYYELRLLPSQIASLVRREADFVRVEASLTR